MTISRDLIVKIAKLSNLSIAETELDDLSKKLSSVFDYMKELEAVDTSTTQPMSHVLDLANVYREDRTNEPLPVTEMLDQAPDKSGRFIRVPIIVEPGTEH